ncbi:MAG: FAD-binding oxidoreductase [Bdellovibrionota bacterium]
MSTTRKILNLKVELVRDLTHQVRELKLKCVEGTFAFRAGQFVMLHVPQEGPKPALRAYSIASAEQDSSGFTLLFKYVENGIASKFVWDLKGDETLQFTGPFGKVFFQEPPTDQAVFLNTGTGLSQHLSFILSHHHKYPQLKWRLLFGVRNEQDIYYQDVLDQVKKEVPNFHYEYVLSRPSETWLGKKGYVQNFISDFTPDTIPSTFYLCGNGAMIKDTKAILAEKYSLDPKRIWAEAFD